MPRQIQPEDFDLNQRVRWISDHSELEPIATVVEVGKAGIKLRWDDGYHDTIVLARRLCELEKL